MCSKAFQFRLCFSLPFHYFLKITKNLLNFDSIFFKRNCCSTFQLLFDVLEGLCFEILAIISSPFKSLGCVLSINR